jgi:histidyl-tRNA synthetase
MAKNVNPAKGMRDFLPQDKAIREHVMSTIRDEYKKNGFTEIETPVIEDIDRLVNSDGGDNTKLIFKILKRGEKLKLDKEALVEKDIVDFGLRFDLTLPLSRFYSANQNDLPKIFKATQMGYVFRAERPQKGRFRSFVQCDIDILGDPTNTAEMELINGVSNTLLRLGIKDFNVKINDRRLLRDVILYCGFTNEQFTNVCIILDKADKIGLDGVSKELLKAEYSEEAVSKLLEVMEKINESGIEYLAALEGISGDAISSVKQIMTVIDGLANERYKITFDFTLVRGMGYYTGTIFEISYGELGYSVAGGGRYDEMIGSMIGKDTPAVGFSIGFERIIGIIKEQDATLNIGNNLCLLFNEDDDMLSVMKLAEKLRNEYDMVSVFKREKKLPKQLSRMLNNGFKCFAFYNDGDIKVEILEKK